jgi:hypothetical protein
VQARSIVIDAPEFLPTLTPITPCTIGVGTCTPVATNLIAAAFANAYIYDRGIISFGSPLPASVGAATDFTTLGIPVIAPLYQPGPSGTAGPFTEVTAGNVAPGALFFNLAQPTFGTDLFIVTFLDPAEDTDPAAAPIVALIIDASTGALRFQFVHGMVNNSSGDQAFPSTAGRQLGYAINGQNLRDDTPDITATNAYSVTLAAVPSVPEPATWMAMLLGFGAIGLTFRRSTRVRAAAF